MMLPYPLNELSRAEVEPVADTYFAGLLQEMGVGAAGEQAA